MKSQKQEALEIIQSLSDEVSLHDIMDELAYIEFAKARIASADSEEVVSHDEALRLLARWPASSGR